ncbi:adenosine deaminase [Arachnia propionica]|uniref:adenosine deaminase n=1 Tax=Arachnia propionica TaxID=1750 RepID=A0A3P1WY15_9ACTN|nr:adenosine deaminase [Arachnia propionica]RRD51449.1 adenosine deaminase [Arachnia propionica]
MLTVDELRSLPKVALHDHLDGGLRPQTVIDHCAENGHELPTTDPEALGRWFFEAADSGSLVRYLEGFAHTCAAMQTREQLVRVAREFVLDQAADGVVHAEARWAPEQHLERGLTLREAVEAVRDGLAEGMAEAERDGRAIVATQLVTAMRHVETPTTEIAELAVEYRDDSVVGFDIAGAEHGFRPSRFQESFDLLRRHNAHFTIHAGEADGPESMWEAIQLCGAQRIGHGVRIVEDIEDLHGPRPRLGRLAAYVRDQQIPLEVCPTSNTQTGIAATIAEHPVGRLAELGFNVTIHCDNRLMSGTSLSREFALLSEAFGWGLAEVEKATVAAMRAAFLHHDEREALVEGIIRPAYRAARRGETA